jgi:hypothetical protein
MPRSPREANASAPARLDQRFSMDRNQTAVSVVETHVSTVIARRTTGRAQSRGDEGGRDHVDWVDAERKRRMTASAREPRTDDALRGRSDALDAVQRLKGMFLEVPGTQLSPSQAARLAGLEPDLCGRVLQALEEARFLGRGRGGLFVRRCSDSPTR